MKFAAITLLLAGSVAIAQQRPNPTGFGSVLYPGTGGPPPPAAHGGFGSVLHPGTGGPPGQGLPRRNFAPPPAAHPSHSRTVIVPYPVYYGGYYYDPAAAQQPAPAYDDANGDSAPSQSPVVVMNQSFRGDQPPPMYRDYAAPRPPEEYNYRPDAPATIYLIALTDHTILPTIAYWVEGDTLAYITAEGDQNRISLALVDREFSKKLNDDRRVEFKLPKQ